MIILLTRHLSAVRLIGEGRGASPAKAPPGERLCQLYRCRSSNIGRGNQSYPEWMNIDLVS